MTNTPSIKIMKQFMDKNNSRPVSTGELMEFWKSCSDAEKLQFTQEAELLLA